MAALTAERLTKSRGDLVLRIYPMAAVQCFSGGMIMIDSAGFATPAAAAAGNKGCVGVCRETIDNSGGGAGDLTVLVQEGEFLYAGDTLAQTAVGGVVFADDDQTLDETQAANAPKAGICTEFVSASSAWVRLGVDQLP